MNLKPLKEYNSPEMPKSGELKKESLMNRFLPEKWQKGIALTGAALLLFAGGSAIHKNIGETAKPGIVFAADKDWGRTAGVVAVPRTFVTEAEAKKMVVDEMAKHNVKFDKTEYKVESKGTGKTVVLDGYSTKSKIGFKIVAEKQWKEIQEWGGIPNCFGSNQNAADYLAKELPAKNKIRCLVVAIPEYMSNKEASVKNITEQINKFVESEKNLKTK
ncbi:MAG: hypothetical protein LWY06_10255 [Firmicutes bacterium]|nr:hypothetical protein [Bacillota bacterium]